MACTNGSEAKPGAPPYFMVDSRETTCALWGQESLVCKWISWAPFGGLVTAVVETASFCAGPPVYPPPLTIADFTSNVWVSKAIELAKAYAWPKYCKCKDKPPDPNKPPSFEGGQCAKNYCVKYSYSTVNTNDQYHPQSPIITVCQGRHPAGGFPPITGPISGFTFGDGGSNKVQYFRVQCATGDLELSSWFENYFYGPPNYVFTVDSVFPSDGSPDNCGSLPPSDPPDNVDPPPPLPPPPNDLPDPPPPPPGPPGPTGPPGKDAPPCVPCKDGLPGLDGKTGPTGAPGPTGAIGPTGPVGPRGPIGQTGASGNDGIAGKDAEVEFVNIIVPVIDCNNYSVVETLRVIQVIKGTENQVKLAHEQAAKTATQQCIAGPPVSAIADWWQVRLQSDVPQLVLIYGPTANRNYHDLSIPHPRDISKRAIAPIGVYTKGSFQGMVICKDNSKFVVNAVSAQLAASLCEEAIAAIDPAWLELPPRVHISQRKGQGVKPELMKPRFLMYFPTGQRQTIPEWRTVIPQ